MVAWTTTPWTLPSNLALCVNPTLIYVTVLDKASGRKYVLCQDRLTQLYKDERKKKDDETVVPMPDETAEYKILERVPGTELVGLHYTPLFDHLAKQDAHYRDVCYVVVSDNFVTSDSGTGVVHCAPTFGEDDYRVCMENKLIVLDTKGVKYLPQPIDDNGLFRTEGQLPQLDGLYVKDADKKVIELLKQSGRLVQRGQLNHSYPFCWRSDTPLLYRAVPSWFVKVTALKSRLLENNEQTYWVPSFVKEKRFHNWLKDARDWAISRNRFWGTPLPIWTSEDGEEIVVVRSIKDLEERSGVSGITDLHRHFIDKITIPSQQGKGVLRRVDEVFDCWFESGSMPYAQQHYPFENDELFKQGFPADFIAEGIDQTRGWFYTLLVISTALFDTPPFKNLIVNGLVLAADGKKMSKRLKNYPDPQDVINQYGADALRLYLIDSPVVRADSLRFEEKGVKAIINDVFNRWFNAYRLFVQNVLRLKGGFKYQPEVLSQSANVMDKWVLSSTQSLIQFVSEEMKYYRLYTVVPRLVKYVNQLANVYVRFNRDRFKGKQGHDEQHIALNVLLQVLLTVVRTMAPFAPFFTESMYQNLKHLLPAAEQQESVHFCSFPTADTKLMDTKIEDSVQLMLDLIELVRTIRDKKKIASKFPLATLAIIGDVDEQTFHSLERYIKSEANVKEIKLTKDKSSYVQYTPSLNFAALGKRLKGDMPKVKELVSALTREQIQDFQTTGSMTLHGHNLTLNDITFKTSYGGGAGEEEGRWEAATTNSLITSTSSGELEGEQKSTLPDVLIVLDTLLTEEFIHEGISREVMNRVQRLRKQAELEPHDEAQFFYRVVAGKDKDQVLPALLKYTKDIEAHTNSRLYSHTKQHPLNVRVVESSTVVWGSQFELCMCRPGLVLTDKARAAFGEEFATNLQTLLLTLNYEHSKKQLVSSGQLTLTLDKRTVTLKLNEDVTLHPQH